MTIAESTDVEIFLLCHNRLDYLREALESLRAQVGVRTRCIVSDNSSNSEVENWFRSQNIADVEYRRRVPSLSVMDHLNVILKEARSPYFMMFHDDDILLPHAVEHLVRVAESHPRASAVAGNAEIIYGQKRTKAKFQLLTTEHVVRQPQDLIRAYLLPVGSHPPFPAYLYRRESTVPVKFDAHEGGKYSDVAFLARLANQGELIWTPEVTMLYRRHTGNDSGKMDLESIVRLARYFCEMGWIRSTEFELRHYLHWHELIHLRDNPWTLREWRMLPGVIGFFMFHPVILISHFLKKIRFA